MSEFIQFSMGLSGKEEDNKEIHRLQVGEYTHLKWVQHLPKSISSGKMYPFSSRNEKGIRKHHWETKLMQQATVNVQAQQPNFLMFFSYSISDAHN